MTAAMTSPITPLIQGFLLCASIIVAFGPQNLFLLRQGLHRQHLFATVFFSTVAEIVLIALGIGGLSALISTSSFVSEVITTAGIIFLVWCGLRALRNAWHPASLSAHSQTSQATSRSLHATILVTLSFAFLNPASYVDTLMIIGSKSLLFSVEHRIIFGIGAVSASAFWFFILTYGASKLALVFRSQVAWRTLDVVSGCIMLGIAATLLSTTCNLV